MLIEKTKPDWQNGLVNGLGGSIEDGESIHEAMVREFKEECGVSTRQKQWQHCLTFGTEDWELNIMRAVLSHYPDVRSCDEGDVKLWKYPPDNMEQTALWLYWMCRDNSTIGLLANGRLTNTCNFERTKQREIEHDGKLMFDWQPSRIYDAGDVEND